MNLNIEDSEKKKEKETVERGIEFSMMCDNRKQHTNWNPRRERKKFSEDTTSEKSPNAQHTLSRIKTNKTTKTHLSHTAKSQR